MAAANVTTPHLTPRQREVLLLICDDQTAPMIARQTGLSMRRVYEHQQAVFEKLGVNTAAGAVVWAIREGIFDPLAEAAVTK